MTEPLAKAGQTIEVQPIEAGCETSQKIPLVKTSDVEIIQFVVPAGEDIPTHEAQGEMIAHCLKGQVVIWFLQTSHDLRAGQLLYLSTNEPFSIQAVENASLLVTIIAAKRGGKVELIGQ